MARSTSLIKAQMIETKNAETALNSLDSPSQTAKWNNFLYIPSVVINIFEQLMDLFKSDIETKIDSAVPNTYNWIQKKVFEFQYSATTPQIVSLVDLVYKYPTVNTNLRIASRCSVSMGGNKTVTVKVAKNNPPEKFDVNENLALLSYLTIQANAGITYNIISVDPDLIELDADIYYNAQYSAIIKDNVISAINSYLSNIDFSGNISIMKLEDAIQSVTGVTDVKIKEVFVRKSFESYSQKITIFSLTSGVNLRFYQPYAGYIVNETEPNKDFANTLNFIP